MKSFIMLLTAFMCSITLKADYAIVPMKRLIVCYRDEIPDWNSECDNPSIYGYECNFTKHMNCTHVIVRSAGNVDPMTAYYTGITKVGYYEKEYYSNEYKYNGPPSKMIQSFNPVKIDFADGAQVVSSKIGRSRLIKSAIKSLKEAHYDGLDVVIEEVYIDDIIQLLIEMSPEFDKNDLLLTALFPATLKQRVDLSYVASNLDFISIKSFRETKIGSVTMLMSPLYAEEGWSVDYSVNLYINMGVPREKIVVGIPTYAVTHQLEHPDFNLVGSNAWKKGRVIVGYHHAQEIFQEGFLSLDEVSANANEGILSRDKSSGAPYVSNYFLWISYEDKISVKTKFSKSLRFGSSTCEPLVSYAWRSCFLISKLNLHVRGVRWILFHDYPYKLDVIVITLAGYTTPGSLVRYIRENDLGGAMLWPKEKYDSSGSPLPFADLLNETLHGGGN